MEDYAKFFGGVDDIDVSDLMTPVLIIGGGTHKSASTVKLFSKKSSSKSRKRTIIPSVEIESIVGSGEGICPAFSELENTKYLEEENKILNELVAVVNAAEIYGGFSDSDEELTDLDTNTAAMAGSVLLDQAGEIGTNGDHNLLSLGGNYEDDNHSLLAISGGAGTGDHSLLSLDDNVAEPTDDASHSLLEITGDQ